MKGYYRIALAAAVLSLLVGGAAAQNKSSDNPWVFMKQLFHEPASKIRNSFNKTGKPAKAAPKKTGEAEKRVSEAEPVRADAAARPEPKPEKVAVPLPAARPDVAETATEVAPAVDKKPEETQTAAVPLPRFRPPEGTTSFAPPDITPPRSRSAAAIGALSAPGLPLIKPPPPSCTVGLEQLGVEAKAIPAVHEGRCGIRQPVLMASLAGGGIDLTATAKVECNLAQTFAKWMEDEVQPIARKTLGGKVVGLRVAASYSCRNRNNLKNTRLSEHGLGNAIDISAFRIEGKGWVEVKGLHGGGEARFLKEVRAAACDPFTTVLGPGSDPYHSDHFHFDLAKRNTKGPSRGLYCK